MLMVLAFSSLAWADCDAPVSPDTLAALGAQVEDGLRSLDKERVLASAQLSAEAIPCLDAPLSPELAAQAHRSQGYSAFLSGDRETALLYFTASAMVAPDYELPADLVPPSHPIAVLYQEGRGSADLTDTLAEPAQGFLVFDGTATELRPTSRPTVGQYVDETGLVAFSAALMPEDPVPGYPTMAVPSDTTPSGSGMAIRWPLVAGTVGAVLVSGGLYAASLKSEDAYYESTSVSEAVSQRRTTHALTVAAGTSATVAVGLGVGTVVLTF